jgi:hypothetical protein
MPSKDFETRCLARGADDVWTAAARRRCERGRLGGLAAPGIAGGVKPPPLTARSSPRTPHAHSSPLANAALIGYVQRFAFLGEVPEWSIGHAWKACVLAREPRVRIPPSPPAFATSASEERRLSRRSPRSGAKADLHPARRLRLGMPAPIQRRGAKAVTP